jgi:trans-aconitate methyltransferase
VDQPASTNYQKYHSSNPLIRWVTHRFLRRIASVLKSEPHNRIVDLGCGEGLVYSALISGGIASDYHGYDISDEAIAYAKTCHPNANWTAANLLHITPHAYRPDIVLCLEVIEHIPDASETLSAIRKWSAPVTVLSVPWEPWFRVGNLARGARWATLGNHPEHVQHFNPRTFRDALSRHWDHVEVGTCFPWIVAICRSND